MRRLSAAKERAASLASLLKVPGSTSFFQLHSVSLAQTRGEGPVTGLRALRQVDLDHLHVGVNRTLLKRFR